VKGVVDHSTLAEIHVGLGIGCCGDDKTLDEVFSEATDAAHAAAEPSVKGRPVYLDILRKAWSLYARQI
jgi:hypothetical protein